MTGQVLMAALCGLLFTLLFAFLAYANWKVGRRGSAVFMGAFVVLNMFWMVIPQVSRLGYARAFDAAVEKLPADMPSPFTTKAGLTLDEDADGTPVPRTVILITTQDGKHAAAWRVPVRFERGNPVLGEPELVK